MGTDSKERIMTVVLPNKYIYKTCAAMVVYILENLDKTSGRLFTLTLRTNIDGNDLTMHVHDLPMATKDVIVDKMVIDVRISAVADEFRIVDISAPGLTTRYGNISI